MLSPFNPLIVVNALNTPITVDINDPFAHVFTNHDFEFSVSDQVMPSDVGHVNIAIYDSPIGPTGPTGPISTITINTAPSDVNEAHLFTISGTSTDTVTAHVESSPLYYPLPTSRPPRWTKGAKRRSN
ncbi:MAG: hypothetical protein KDA47_06480 [Planctomycetales bacterium]|nr:hypothetical protein [Planctomycetales bacterium]